MHGNRGREEKEMKEVRDKRRREEARKRSGLRGLGDSWEWGGRQDLRQEEEWMGAKEVGKEPGD